MNLHKLTMAVFALSLLGALHLASGTAEELYFPHERQPGQVVPGIIHIFDLYTIEELSLEAVDFGGSGRHLWKGSLGTLGSAKGREGMLGEIDGSPNWMYQWMPYVEESASSWPSQADPRQDSYMADGMVDASSLLLEQNYGSENLPSLEEERFTPQEGEISSTVLVDGPDWIRLDPTDGQG
jgi:hypothetical protein